MLDNLIALYELGGDMTFS